MAINQNRSGAASIEAHARATAQRNQPGKTPNVARVLAAAAVAASLALSGCGSDFQATQAAKTNIQDAARIAASAGQPQTTPALTDAIKSGQDPTALQQTIERDLQAKGQQYVTQQSVEQDLNKALDRLRQVASADLSPAMHSLLQAQQGDIQLRLSQQKLAELQRQIADLSAEAMDLQMLAKEAVELTAQAQGLSAHMPAAGGADVDGARAALSSAQSAAAKADTAIKALQDKIAADQASARDIYSRTDAAFTAADALKGQAAIDAANKAMDDRKQAEDLMVEVDGLQSNLDTTQADQAQAHLEVTQAQQALNTAQKAHDEQAATLAQTQTRIAALQDAAKKILDGQDVGGRHAPGVSDQFKALSALADKIDAQVKSAAADADQAASSFSQATNDYRSYQSAMNDKVQNLNLDRSDPVVRFTQDTRMQAILTWSKAAAEIQSGQVSLAGYQAAKIMALAAREASAAGLANASTSLAAATYQSAAASRFGDARQTAENQDSAGGANLDSLKWLGQGLEALADYGQYLTETGASATAKTAAGTAAASALKGNPALSSTFDWITQ